MLPTRAPFFPFPPSLDFESYDSHHPSSMCPESAEDMVMWGSPSPPQPVTPLGILDWSVGEEEASFFLGLCPPAR